MEKTPSINPSFFVGNIPVFGDLILAPMDGISDQPFRSLTYELGSAMSYTEFIPAIDVIHSHPHLDNKITYSAHEHPIVFQLCDNNPEQILKAALLLQKYHPDIIDINLGCSDKQVSNRGAGAGLLREPGKVETIFRLLSQALTIPVTAKIRLGWDDDHLNYLEIARIIEENGGKLVAVHGRTRKQMYTGKADWDAIAQVKQALSIPVIANGDVITVADISQIKNHTRCDAVMIGRAAVGNPWIFSRMDRNQVSQGEVYRIIRFHLSKMVEFYGRPSGVILFRKYIKKYLSFYVIPPETDYSLVTCQDEDELVIKLERLFNTVLPIARSGD